MGNSGSIAGSAQAELIAEIDQQTADHELTDQVARPSIAPLPQHQESSINSKSREPAKDAGEEQRSFGRRQLEALGGQRSRETPMAKEPIILTAAVAYGVGVPSARAVMRFTPCRAADPSAPPTNTASHVIAGHYRRADTQ